MYVFEPKYTLPSIITKSLITKYIRTHNHTLD